jgi:hypothetical protein
LKSGECIVNDKWASSLGVKEGSLVYMKLSAPNLMNTLINRYNNFTGKKLRAITSREPITIPCKTKYVTSTTNGKYS